MASFCQRLTNNDHKTPFCIVKGQQTRSVPRGISVGSVSVLLVHFDCAIRALRFFVLQ